MSEKEAIVVFMREAVDQGYPGPSGKRDHREQCEHGRFYYEDCIACYDAYLHGKLDAIQRGDHLKAQVE